MASRGDGATFGPYAVGPARQLGERKVFRIYAGPDTTSDATIASNAAPIASNALVTTKLFEEAVHGLQSPFHTRLRAGSEPC